MPGASFYVSFVQKGVKVFVESAVVCWNSQLTKSGRYAIIYKLSTRQRHSSDAESTTKKVFKKLLKKGLTKRSGCDIIIRLSQRAATKAIERSFGH